MDRPHGPQASDKTTAPELVGPLALSGDVIADRGYFARPVAGAIEASGARAHIPSQSNVRVRRSVNPALYRRRNVIERYLLKHFRGVATRHQKLARRLPRRRPPRFRSPLAQAL